MISMVSLVNTVINLISSVWKVNVNIMISMVIRVNEMGSNVNRRNANISMAGRGNTLFLNFYRS